mmetsp:Transcript_38233/g.94841  ORF Transcript_38233/g.94841 Transcript_38233/m.94841 type:complete len:270 (-) Transcript_38233:337-1146(-)
MLGRHATRKALREAADVGGNYSWLRAGVVGALAKPTATCGNAAAAAALGHAAAAAGAPATTGGVRRSGGRGASYLDSRALSAHAVSRYSSSASGKATAAAAWAAASPKQLVRHASSSTRVCDWATAPTAPADAAGAEQPSDAPPPPSSSSSPENAEHDFHVAADELLENLEDAVEAWGEENAVVDFDLVHEMGVLTIAMGEHGTYVLNKQGPNRQVWVSSPVSGPLRFDYDHDNKCWVYGRDGSLLHRRLEEELTGMGGGQLDLSGLNH